MRIVVGYGACESDRQAKKLETYQKERKLKLSDYLEAEVIEAIARGPGIIIQIDANATIGPD